ncbi:MAG TPA: GFA family protein [Acetobacteraceae bacterium]|nr:GFA family protein [Acetobacteraceae bacterium]
MDTMSLPLAGGCRCRAVRYEIAHVPLMVYACHCTLCQLITSRAFSIGVVAPEATFRLTRRAPRTAPDHAADSGRIKICRICHECGI